MSKLVKNAFNRSLGWLINTKGSAKGWSDLEEDVIENLCKQAGKKGAIRFYDYRDFGSFANMLADLGSDVTGATEYEVLIPDNVAISADTTINANLKIRGIHSGSFTVAAGKTLIINGDIISAPKLLGTGSVTINKMSADPLHQIFDGPTVTFAAGAVPHVRPEWWGAAGNNSNDDTSAVQSAITTGVDVNFGERGLTYLVASTISLVSNQKLYGGAKLKLSANPQTGLFKADTKENITIDGLRFEGTNTNTVTPIVERMLYFLTCSNIEVKNCEIEKTSIALQFQTCTNWKVNDNYIHDILRSSTNTQGYGVLINTDNTDISVENNRFHTIGRHAIYLSNGTTNFKVTGNKIYSCVSSAITTNAYHQNSDNAVQNGLIDHNVINNVTDPGGAINQPRGIDIANKCYDITISNNRLTDVDLYGINCEGDTAYEQNRPRRIKINGNHINGGASIGIWCLNSDDVDIQNNTIYDRTTGITCASSPIGTFAQSTGCYIAHNTIRKMSSRGINISENVTDYRVGINKFYDVNVTWEISPDDNSEVTFEYPVHTMQFYHVGVVANTTVLANHSDTIDVYFAHKKLWAISVSARITGSQTTGTATISLTKNGIVYTDFDIVFTSASARYLKTSKNLKDFAVAEGDTIGIQIVTSADYTAAGVRDIVMCVEMIDRGAEV